MNIKFLQIMLVIAAVLCAVAIVATFNQEVGVSKPAEFSPPGWLRSLRGLRGGPRLTAGELTRNNRAFPEELRLRAGETAAFSVASVNDDSEVRRAVFGVRGNVHLQYRPVAGQKLGGESVEIQNWPTPKDPDAEPVLIVYDRGGTIIIRNRGGGTASVELED